MNPGLKLNLGCGSKQLPGWVNVDKFPAARPDQILDLEELPWPWADDSVDAVMLAHVLEHIGRSTDNYLGILKEVWRVCRHGAEITVVLPHPRHDYFLIDPTHIRAIHPRSFEHFSQKLNRQWVASGTPATPLGLYLGIDFDIVSVTQILAPKWTEKFQRGELTDAGVRDLAENMNNVIMEFTVVLRAVKTPAG